MRHLFSHGVTTLVVTVISVDDGQATCRIVRRLHEPRRRPQEYYRWLHTQPHQGEEITVPMSMLRPCKANVKLRGERRKPCNWRLLGATAVCAAVYLLAVSIGPGKPASAPESARMLDATIASCDATIERHKLAHSVIKNPNTWRKWSHYYYTTGRSDDDLIDDLCDYGRPVFSDRVDSEVVESDN